MIEKVREFVVFILCSVDLSRVVMYDRECQCTARSSSLKPANGILEHPVECFQQPIHSIRFYRVCAF